MRTRTNFYGSFIEHSINLWNFTVDLVPKLNNAKKVCSEIEDKIEQDYFWFENVSPIDSKINMNCSLVVILVASGIEGYLYDYAASNLSESYAKRIERLTLQEKVIVIPHLITGKEFPREKKAFCSITQLIRDRNYLIHNKSCDVFSFNQKTSDIEYSASAKKMRDFIGELYDKAENAIECLFLFASEIEDLDDDAYTSFHLGINHADYKKQSKITYNNNFIVK